MHFELDDYEIEEARKFIEQTRREYVGCSGGQYTYSFTPTTLGCAVMITDNMTNVTKSLTDFSKW